MNLNVTAALVGLSLPLAGCASAGTTPPGTDPGNGDGGDAPAASTRLECPEALITPPAGVDNPNQLADPDTEFPAGFEYASDLQPSCVLTNSANGVTHYLAYYVGATEDEVSSAYADTAASAQAAGWTTATEDADTLGDNFINGEWFADADDPSAPGAHVQGYVPLGPDMAGVLGVDPAINLLAIDIAVSG